MWSKLQLRFNRDIRTRRLECHSPSFSNHPSAMAIDDAASEADATELVETYGMCIIL